MKKIVFFLFSFWIPILFLNAQTVYPDYEDGKIYFKIKITEPINFKIEKNNLVPTSELPFLEKLKDEFGITKVTRPLTFGNDPNLLRYIFVKFDSIEKIDLIIKILSNVDIIEDAGKRPLIKAFWEPNDPYYGTISNLNLKWFLDLIKADSAWNIKRGSSNIKVAVVDNAIWGEHPDLQIPSQLQFNGITGTVGNSAPPLSVFQTCHGYYNCSGYGWSHGTHCAGLVGAVTNNKLGISSIGGGVTLMGARCSETSSRYFDSDAIMAGVTWAAENGAKVISMSYGSDLPSPPEQAMYENCRRLGIVLVAAAGNDSDTAHSYPAAYSSVIAVASVNSDRNISSFSNYGSWVDIAAPGGFDVSGSAWENPTRAMFSSTYSQNSTLANYSEFAGQYYDVMQGTSMACPVAAGLCGLMLSKNPDLTPEQVKQILQSTSQPLREGSLQIGPNTGVINAYAAMQAVAATVPNASFKSDTTKGAPGVDITFTNTTPAIPAAINSCKWYFPGATPDVSTSATPTVKYNTPGIYPVTLVVINANNQKDSLVKENFINIIVPNASPVYLAIDRDTVFIDSYESANGYFNLVSNTNWTVSDTSSWISATSSSGSGNNTITVELNQNPRDQERASTIVASGENNITTSVVVKQKGAFPFLTVNTDSVSILAEGGAVNIVVSSNANWTVTGLVPWLTATYTPDGGNQTLTLTASANNTIISRSVRFNIVTSGGIIKQVYLTQQNIPISLVVNPSTLTIGAVTGAEGEFEISTTEDWSIYEIPIWLTVDSSEGSGNARIRVIAKSNNEKEDGTSREKKLEVIARGVKKEVLVIQQNLDIDLRQKTEETFLIYPNPFKDVIHIENNTSSQIKELSVFDLSGRLLFNKQIFGLPKNISLDMSLFFEGVYSLKIVTTKGNSHYKRLIKQ